MTDSIASRRTARAIKAKERQLASAGGNASEWYALGELLLADHLFEKALGAMQKAVALAPRNTRYAGGLALALSWNRRYEEAIRLRLSQAHRSPRDIATLADDMKYAHDFAGAIELVDAAEAAGAALPAAKFVRGLAKLFSGRYRDGFADLEHRFEAGMAKQPNVAATRAWDGAVTHGLKLLVYPDQGLGDDIMMSRFLGTVARSGIEPTLLARGPIFRLLAASQIDAHVVSAIPNPDVFDAICTTNSLPHLTGFDGSPPAPLTLSIPAAAAVRGQAIVAGYRDAFRIGVCWTGNPRYPRNAMRSASPRVFEALTHIDGLAFFSLCKDDATAALASAGLGDAIIDASSNDADLADTAGLVAALDLVISTDTVIVHLAASLGKPVWNLLPQESMWQYGITGDTTPWYPTMRLFRQPRRGDWDNVMHAVVNALSATLQARS